MLIILLVVLVAFIIFRRKKRAAEAAQAESKPFANFEAEKGIDNDAPSLRDEAGETAKCAVCGKAVAGFGASGGYCAACKAWSYDREKYVADISQYGESGETLHVLMAYGNAHLHSSQLDIRGVLLATPGQLIVRTEHEQVSRQKRIRYEDVNAVSSTVGASQQMILLVRESAAGKAEEAQPESISIDLSGFSYDGANGDDLMRLKQLIDGYCG